MGKWQKALNILQQKIEDRAQVQCRGDRRNDLAKGPDTLEIVLRFFEEEGLSSFIRLGTACNERDILSSPYDFCSLAELSSERPRAAKSSSGSNGFCRNSLAPTLCTFSRR